MKNIKTYEDVINESMQQEMDKDLSISVSANDVERVNKLLKMGANPNAVDNRGMTPLHVAAMHGRVVLIRLFIDRGAEIDARTLDGWTPLHYAVLSPPKKSNFESVILLLDRGAQVDALTHDGRTPLRVVVKRRVASIDPGEEAGYKEIAKIFMLRGADPFKAFDEPGDIPKFFDEGFDWMPEGPLKAKLNRLKRSRQAFGM